VHPWEHVSEIQYIKKAPRTAKIALSPEPFVPTATVQQQCPIHASIPITISPHCAKAWSWAANLIGKQLSCYGLSNTSESNLPLQYAFAVPGLECLRGGACASDTFEIKTSLGLDCLHVKGWEFRFLRAQAVGGQAGSGSGWAWCDLCMGPCPQSARDRSL